jgi:hypothetical protein
MDEIEYGATVAAQEEYEMESTFATLRTINVNEHVEKKGNLSYLSWAWAVDILLQRDPKATWEYRFGKDAVPSVAGDFVFLDVPYIRIGETAMVFCTVKAFGVERTAQLPVMDHKNKPISDPDSFAVNTAMQRCLAKAIALHGIGLYIYAGEDVPQDPEAEAAAKAHDEKLRLIAEAIIAKHAAENEYGAYEEWATVTDNEDKLAIWKMLQPHSRVRSAIKAQADLAKEAA